MKFAAFLLGCIVFSSAHAAEEADPGSTKEAVTLPMGAGASVESALAALNAKGFHIVYSSALVQPAMTLRGAPKSTRIEQLLQEILSPWKLRAVRATNGDWLVTAAEAAVPQTTAIAPAVVEDEQDIETIDVTASRMLLATAGASQTFLDRDDVERMPHLADDAVRMLKVLPGVTGGDISAALNIRGGRREEAALLIDGAEIHNAFHFRDIDGALSVLDTNLVQGIDFITGGMTAEYGDYMSGVVGLQSRRPSADDEYHNGVGISFVSAYGRSSGTFADERGSWLVSARRGFLDVLTKQAVQDDEQLTPRYTDVFAATNYTFEGGDALEARILLSNDDLRFITHNTDDDSDSAGKGHSAHVWLTHKHAWTGDLQMNTMVSFATMNQSRNSNGIDDKREGEVRADNDFRFFDLKQEWSWDLGGRNLPRWGFSASHQTGDYDYALVARITDPLITPVPYDIVYSTKKDVSANKLGAYASWRARLTDTITAEGGGRWDRVDYGAGQSYDVVSPRVNLVYSLNAGNEFRAAWGVMYQPQGVHELQVEDNVTNFFEPERSQQAVVGYTRHFSHGFTLRVDLYDKQYSHLHPRFENLLDPVQLIPEGNIDRIRIDAPEASARGVEFTLRRQVSRGLSGWMSLSIAKTEEKDAGVWTARTWDQRETLSFGTSWTGSKWNVSVAGLVHSGSPSTFIGIESTPLPGGDVDVTGVVGERNAERLSTYARVDLRANRDVLLANSKLSFYLEVTNLLNRKNECCIETYHVVPGRNNQPFLDIQPSYWLPMLPSFGFQWEF